MISQNYKLFFFLTPVLLAASCCNQSFEGKIVKSPDGMVEAVLVRADGGATTSSGLKIYLFPSGTQKNQSTPVLVGDHFSGLKIEWVEPRLLRVRYDEGRIFQFTNFWQSNELGSFDYVVEIQLAPTTQRFSLSPRDRGVQNLNPG